MPVHGKMELQSDLGMKMAWSNLLNILPLVPVRVTIGLGPNPAYSVAPGKISVDSWKLKDTPGQDPSSVQKRERCFDGSYSTADLLMCWKCGF